MPKYEDYTPKNKTKATVKQNVLIGRRLKRQYPQMYEEGWGKTKPKKGLVSRLKRLVRPKKKTPRTQDTYSGMKAAGVDYEKEKPSAKLRRKK